MPRALYRKIFALTILLTVAGQSVALERVVLFSQTYCAFCDVAKAYLEANQIPYSEFMIDKSQAARDYFIKLGGRGTPFFIIDNQRMQGFEEKRFWQLYGSPSETTR